MFVAVTATLNIGKFPVPNMNETVNAPGPLAVGRAI
jgi:hypothetical protein